MMRSACLLAILACACGDNAREAPDAALADAPPRVLSPDADPLEPPTLAGTGLCLDAACTQISPDVRAYTPNFVLWADTSTKQRWIYLPPGTQIDTSDMDHWVFPQGTKIWKEFTRGGHRVETRYIAKIGPGNTFRDWFYVSYAWNSLEDVTIAVPFGLQDALSTGADIPARSACFGCHENLPPTRVLGFGAIQLDHPAAPGEIALQDLIDQGLLTNPPSGHFALPGTSDEQAALGYLHANCGHCHNPSSQVTISGGIVMNLRLVVGALGSTAATPTYRTAVGQPATSSRNGETVLVVPQQPDQSVVIYRFETNNIADHMPALGSSFMDPTGDAILRTWITNLP